MIQSAELPWSLQKRDEFIPVQKFMNNHNEVCLICRSSNLITDSDSGEIVCSKCGMVISDTIQENRESRTFLNTEQAKDRRRTGMPTSLASADMGLSTFISRNDKDAGGYEIDPSMASTMHRLRTWDFRTQVRTSADRNFRLAFTELHMLKANMPHYA